MFGKRNKQALTEGNMRGVTSKKSNVSKPVGPPPAGKPQNSTPVIDTTRPKTQVIVRPRRWGKSTWLRHQLEAYGAGGLLIVPTELMKHNDVGKSADILDTLRFFDIEWEKVRHVFLDEFFMFNSTQTARLISLQKQHNFDITAIGTSDRLYSTKLLAVASVIKLSDNAYNILSNHCDRDALEMHYMDNLLTEPNTKVDSGRDMALGVEDYQTQQLGLFSKLY